MFPFDVALLVFEHFLTFWHEIFQAYLIYYLSPALESSFLQGYWFLPKVSPKFLLFTTCLSEMVGIDF